MRIIDADALMETIRHFVDTMSVCPSTDYCNGLRFMKKQAIEAVENAPTVDAISMREWNLLRNSIKELQENNTEKKDVQFVTKFLLRLMDISERREKNV